MQTAKDAGFRIVYITFFVKSPTGLFTKVRQQVMYDPIWCIVYQDQ